MRMADTEQFRALTTKTSALLGNGCFPVKTAVSANYGKVS